MKPVRILAFVIVLLMVSALFTGCGSKKSSDIAGNNTTGGNTKQSSSTDDDERKHYSFTIMQGTWCVMYDSSAIVISSAKKNS